VRPPVVVATRNLGSAAAAAMVDGGELGAGGVRLGREHICFIGTAASHCAHGLPRWAQGRRPQPVRSAGGERGRTGGYSGERPSTNAGAPRGGPDFKGDLGARNALARRGTSVGAGPGRRGRRGSGTARAQRAMSRRGVGQPATISLYPALNA
jgi:hypothetical protein